MTTVMQKEKYNVEQKKKFGSEKMKILYRSTYSTLSRICTVSSKIRKFRTYKTFCQASTKTAGVLALLC